MAIEKYKGMVVGVGAIGALLESEPKRPKPATHAGALKKNKKTELVAIVDTEKDILGQAHKLFPETRAYVSLDEAFSIEKPDIVCIATPSGSHLDIVRKALEAGVKMIVCEKPIASTYAEALILKELLVKETATFVLNYQRRYFSLFTEARELIKEGMLGDIQQVTSYYSNGLYNNGGHAIDAILFLLGDTMSTSNGTLTKGIHPVGDIQVNAHLVTTGGVSIQLIALDQEAYGIHDIQVFGTKGALNFTNYGYTRTYTPVRPSLFAQVKQLASSHSKQKVKKESMVAGALMDAITSYESKKEPRSGIENGLTCMKVLDDIRDSTHI